MPKPKKPAKGKKRIADDGYPFETGDWEKWTNRKRLDWLTNLRDKARDKYKDTLNITDKDIAQMDKDVETMEAVVIHEEYTAANEAARKAPSPRESAVMLGKIIDDICANDYYKARRIGITDEQIDKMRADTDKYAREIEEWERRENAKKILGFAPPAKQTADDAADEIERRMIVDKFSDIDHMPLKKALESGDTAAVRREWDKLIPRLEAKAAKDPVFGAWFHEFCAEQERLLRWDDVIGDES